MSGGRRGQARPEGDFSGIWTFAEVQARKLAGTWDPDPHWANVVALLRFNGANGSTAMADETGRNWTAASGAVLSTAWSAHGKSSLSLPSTGANVTTANSADFAWHSQPYTIEAFINVSTYGGDSSGRGRLLGQGVAVPGNLDWSFGPTSAGKLNFFYWGGSVINVTGTTTIPTATKQHVAMTFDSTTIRVFLEGNLEASLTYTAAAAPGVGNLLRIGFGDFAYIGKVDELRITKGVARYTASFQPPVTPFPNF